MATHESNRAPRERKTAASSLEEAVLGLTQAGVRVRELPELGAVQLAVVGDDGEAEVEMVLSPDAALDLVLRVVGALARLRGWDDAP